MTAPRPDLNRWATRKYGPDWRRLGVVVMEAWAEHVFGPHWRKRLEQKPKPLARALTIEDVLPDCRQWFLDHVPGDGWHSRVVVNSGMGVDQIGRTRRRLQQRAWALCSVCNVPVFDDEWVMKAGKPRHPDCEASPHNVPQS